jgi:hypothetical protein
MPRPDCPKRRAQFRFLLIFRGFIHRRGSTSSPLEAPVGTTVTEGMEISADRQDYSSGPLWYLAGFDASQDVERPCGGAHFG